jgi:hypothetical protein
LIFFNSNSNVNLVQSQQSEKLQDGNYLFVCDLRSGWASIFKGGVPIGGNAWDNKFELYPDDESLFVIPCPLAAAKTAPVLLETSPVGMDPLLEFAMVTVLCEAERVFRGT